MWTLLADEDISAPTTIDHQLMADSVLDAMEMNLDQYFIDDEYHEQMELSFTSPHSPTQNMETLTYYPSAASFPDLDFGIQQKISHRTRFVSSSEPELPTNSCHQALRQRMRKWGSALWDAWSSNDTLDCDVEVDDETSNVEDEGEERKGVATPP